MNYIAKAFTGLARRGQHNFAKILCLGLGLAISSVFIAEIYYEQTFDTYFPEASRTYYVLEKYKTGDMSEMQSSTRTPGAWAPGVKDYVPFVEAATRFTPWCGDETQLRLQGRSKDGEDEGNAVTSSIGIADSCFFDVFPQRILAGNARTALSTKNTVVVSSELAKTIGGDVVGRRFTVDDCPGITFTIGAVFEAFPWGSSLHGKHAFLSMASMGDATYDGSRNWVGNDRYSSFVRLAKGHDIGELHPYMKKMLAENIDQDMLKKVGAKLEVDFRTLNEYYTSDSYVRMMKWILGIVAFVMLFTSVMNYLLIIVSNTVSRSREMAVRKCFGAGKGHIFAQTVSEAVVHVGLSVVLAAVLLYACKGTVEDFLSAPLAALLFNRGAWILAVIVMAVIFIGGVATGWLFLRTPVTAAFRGWTAHRRRWKLALLACEFAIVGLMMSLLWVVGAQYGKLTRLDPGYKYDNVAILNVYGLQGSDSHRCLDELRRDAHVSLLSTATYLPLDGWFGSGNNISLPGSDEELFNAQDLYFVGDNFFKMLDIRITQGSFFTDRSDTCRQVMVSEEFAKRLAKAAGWKDGVVGKRVFISEHCSADYPYLQIVGVFNNILLGGMRQENNKSDAPSMVFYSPADATHSVLLKFDELTPETMLEVRQKMERLFPGKNVSLLSYASEFEKQYESQRNFRNGILVSGAVVFVIAILGLLGYSSDEVSRRSKEIAIRKVNGARVSDILRLLVCDVMRVALPSVLAGCVGAWVIAARWLQNFTVRISLSPWIFLAVTAAVLLVVGLSVGINCRKVALSNPVDYLKDE